MDTAKKEVARYSYAPWYEFGTGLNGFWRVPRRLVSAFEKVAGPIPPGASIMDFGCGTGRLSRALLKAQPNVTILGVEPGEKMAAVYRDNLANRSQCELVVGGLDADVSFSAKDSFDLVASAGVFDHIDLRKTPAFKNLLDVIKPGGHLAFSYERNPDGTPYELRRGIYHRYSDDVIHAALRQSGAAVRYKEDMVGFIRTTGISEGKLPQLSHYGLVVARKPA